MTGKGPMPCVVARRVSHTYGDGAAQKTVLSDVDFSLAHGELVVLTGHSGAGKTTLLTLIGAIRALQAGSIDVMGRSLAHKDSDARREVRRHIGFIFQNHNLFDALSVFQTLWLATELAELPLSREEACERAEVLLAKLGMRDYLHAMPRQLSMGQKQRVAVARALINSPGLILGDEPTASLDHGSSMQVMDLIRDHLTSTSASALVVTHDARVFNLADRVLRLEDGQLVPVQ